MFVSSLNFRNFIRSTTSHFARLQRPSQASLCYLLVYADILIQTCFAASPLPEITIPSQTVGRSYHMPFTLAPPTPGTFIEEPEVAEENSGDMDVDPSTPTGPAPGNTGA